MLNSTESSYTVAQSDINRSVFDLSHDLITTFNVGDLVPILLSEVLPSDTFSIDTAMLCRLQTLIAPIFGDLYLDTYYFFVPSRLTWEHWTEFLGANNTTAWTQPTTYTIPQLVAPTGGWQKGTIAQAFGCRIGVDNYSVNALPFRAYGLIYNHWFRSENIQDCTYVPLDDSTVTGTNGSNVLVDLIKGGKYAKIGKLRDLFVNCLPAPQKGADVLLPIGDSAPVLFDSSLSNYKGKTYDPSNVPAWVRNSGSVWQSPTQRLQILSDPTDHTLESGSYTGTAGSNLTIDNAYADLSQATAVTINSLRLAFQTQRLLERDARGGTRYNELIYSHFNTICPDYRLQYPELLSMERCRLDISSVVQSSESGTTPQGTITAYSTTGNYNSDFTRSFVEHGYIIGLCAVRYKHLYSQGLPKILSKKDRLDFYWPVLANIGEQPVFNRELYCTGTNVDGQVFGYMEAWYDYRNMLNRCSGEMSPDYSLSLSQWTLADNYASTPALSPSWFVEDEKIVDNVIAVPSTASDQLKLSFHFKITAARPMPVHSIPGLIDHH